MLPFLSSPLPFCYFFLLSDLGSFLQKTLISLAFNFIRTFMATGVGSVCPSNPCLPSSVSSVLLLFPRVDCLEDLPSTPHLPHPPARPLFLGCSVCRRRASWVYVGITVSELMKTGCSQASGSSAMLWSVCSLA